MEVGSGARTRGLEARERPVPRSPALILLGSAVAAVAAGALLNARRVEPFTTWHYVFAWYPTLVALDALIALRRGRFLLLSRPRAALSLLAWSVPAWMFFELLNLRIENWYYVFVPDRRAAAWAGISLSFATVLPAAFLSATAAAEVLPLQRLRWRRLRVTGALLRGLRAAGVAMLVLPLLWPPAFYPLVWGTLTLILEPANYRRDPRRSLLADLEAGRPQRLLALLCGGAAIGFLWELYNVNARGKWIYTVPGLEELKLFEMPLLGFLGFPVFALECFALVQWLVLRRLAADVPGAALCSADVVAAAKARATTGALRRILGAGGGLAFAAAMLLAMERHTILSTTPRLRDLPGLLPSQVEALAAWGITTPFALAEAEPQQVAERLPGVGPQDAEPWVHAARLSTLRGIGTEWARRLWRLGVRSIDDLAAAEPEALAACLAVESGRPTNPRRIRVWVNAARRAAAPLFQDTAARLYCEPAAAVPASGR